ncbi:putative toxin-antitoxin system toxin component, PIN family [Spirosoma areae]
MIRAVIDTNIFWVSVSRRSSSHWLFEQLIAGDYTLAVTTDILHEYEEIIAQKMNSGTANSVMEMLDYLPNVEPITRYYRWHLIVADPDDDKFVDCTIAANATCLVTHDNHFNLLRKVDFPQINVIDLVTFKELLTNQS